MNAHRRARGVRLGVRSHGVTLLEIMIVLALLVGLAAIALPTLMGDLERRVYEEAVQTVTSQLLLARAHAQATGRAVEVSYRPEGPSVVARFFDPARDLAQENEDEDPRRERRRDAAPARDASGGPGAPDAPDVIYENWAFRELGDGVTITREPPPDPDAVPGAFGPFGADALARERGANPVSEEAERIRIAVFLPDGSSLLGEPVWITGAERRAGELSVNAWTGLPSFAPRTAGAVDERNQDEPEDEADLFGDDEGPEDAVGPRREPPPVTPAPDEEDAP